MTDEQPEAQKPRSKRLYVYWGVALALLLALGLVCWLVVVPVWKTKRVVLSCEPVSRMKEEEYRHMIRELGGPVAATEALSGYVGLPACVAPRKASALILLGECGRPAVPALLMHARSDNAEVRSEAVGALFVIVEKDPSALEEAARSGDKEDAELARVILQVGREPLPSREYGVMVEIPLPALRRAATRARRAAEQKDK